MENLRLKCNYCKKAVILLVVTLLLPTACSNKETKDIEKKISFDCDGVYVNEDLYIDGSSYENNINIHYIFNKPIKSITVEEIDYESDVDASVRVTDCETVIEDNAEDYNYMGYSVGNCIIKCNIENIVSPGYIKIKSIKLMADGSSYNLAFDNIKYTFCDYTLESEDELSFNVAPSYAMDFLSGWEINLSVNEDNIKIDELYVDDCVGISDMQISKNDHVITDNSFNCKKGDVINYELEFSLSDKLKSWSNANFTYKILYHKNNDDTQYCISRNILYVTMTDPSEYDDFIDYMLKKVE